MTKPAEALYKERLKRINDAIALKVPDRVPIAPLIKSFPLHYAGITIKEALNDYSKIEYAWDKFYTDFEPDLAWDPVVILPAKIMEHLDSKFFRVDENKKYQFVDGEYMKEDEYEEFLFDPTDYLLRKWFPRCFGNLKGLSSLAALRDSQYRGWLGTLSSFGIPEVKEALTTLIQAGEILSGWFGFLNTYREKVKKLGFPLACGGICFVPYDLVGDTLRGTRGIMIDLYRQPKMLEKALEKMAPIALETGLNAYRKSGNPFIYIGLHKGSKGFLSDEQYRRFYWPGMRELIWGLVDAGCTPIIYCEGNYTPRLEIIKDVPPGKTAFCFETVDMVKAKETLGDVACIFGNAPVSLLMTSTPERVEAYCKELIDVVGKGGGLIMDTSAILEDAKPENLMALFKFTKEYGVYQ